MGKKSREKRERENNYNQEQGRENNPGKKPFLVNVIFFGICLAFFTPFFFNGKFYFPFVGPKSLLFIAISQIVFFLWLFLAIKHKEYRPKLNSVLIALILFLIVFILSSIFGIDSSRSFWSKYERMTGLLMWLHLFAFFLVCSSTLKKVSDWKKIFLVSICAAGLISIMAFLEIAGVKSFKFADRGGSTLGNTSFLGTYLLFNAFLVLWFLFQAKKTIWKILYAVGFLFIILVIYLSEAKAAYISTFGALVFIFLLWLSFGQQHRKVRIFGKTCLVFFSFLILFGLIMLLIPGSPVNNKFIQMTGKARVVNWEIAQKGIAEKPILGWGPETYDLVFTKFFNPCFFTEKCGGEIWFDRSHNIVFDTLVTTGIFGFITYVGLFLSFFLVFIKKYFKDKSIDFWTFSIFPATFAAYFVQNLTVFDMMLSLMMFVVFLAFASFLKNMGREENNDSKRLSKIKSVILGIVLFIVFCFTINNYFIKSWKTDSNIIAAVKTTNLTEKNELLEKVINGSPMGDYQAIEFLSGHIQEITKNNIERIRNKELPEAEFKKELDLIIGKLEEFLKKSPLDLRNILRLAHIHNVYSLLDTQKILIAEGYGQRAIDLSPKNQQGYWALAQTKALERKFDDSISLCKKAIDLEPTFQLSYSIALQIAEVAGNFEEAKKIAERGTKENPNWEFNIQQVPAQ